MLRQAVMIGTFAKWTWKRPTMDVISKDRGLYI